MTTILKTRSKLIKNHTLLTPTKSPIVVSSILSTPIPLFLKVSPTHLNLFIVLTLLVSIDLKVQGLTSTVEHIAQSLLTPQSLPMHQSLHTHLLLTQQSLFTIPRLTSDHKVHMASPSLPKNLTAVPLTRLSLTIEIMTEANRMGLAAIRETLTPVTTTEATVAPSQLADLMELTLTRRRLMRETMTEAMIEANALDMIVQSLRAVHMSQQATRKSHTPETITMATTATSQLALHINQMATEHSHTAETVTIVTAATSQL